LERAQLLRAFERGKRERAQDCGRDRERIDQPRDIRAQRASGTADAAEHVLELATLLQEHVERPLPALQAHDDVGDLRRQAAHRERQLLGAHAQRVRRGDGLALLRVDLVELVQVRLENARVDAALLREHLVEITAGARARLERRDRALDRRDQALRAAVDFASGFIAAGAQRA
jgi:hypothetical protein